MSSMFRIFAIVYCFLLLSCGGGGGGGGNTDDTTPPASEHEIIDNDTNNSPDEAEDVLTFSLGLVRRAPLGEVIESDYIYFDNLSNTHQVSISAGEYSINDQEYTSEAGSIQDGDKIRVRTSSSAEYNTLVSATLTIGSVSSSFRIITTHEYLLFAAESGNGDLKPSLWSLDSRSQFTGKAELICTDCYKPRYYQKHNGIMLFQADSGLWASDGSANYTFKISDVAPYSFNYLDDELYFSNTLSAFSGLWRTDGSPEGTVLIKEFREIGELHSLGGKLVFKTITDEYGLEPWVSDGTSDGTGLLRDIVPGGGWGAGMGIGKSGEKVYFGGHGEQDAGGDRTSDVWVTDGNIEGTRKLHSLPSAPFCFQQFEDKTIFISSGSENRGVWEKGGIWETNGTEQGTRLLKEISSAILSNTYGWPNNCFTELDGDLYFQISLPFRTELWISNGTELGTHQIDAVNDSDASKPYLSNPRDFTPLNGKVYFSAWHVDRGGALWVTDGTEIGTQEVTNVDIAPMKDIRLGNDRYRFSVFNNKLHFGVKNTTGDIELWSSDGTKEKTRIVRSSTWEPIILK